MILVKWFLVVPPKEKFAAQMTCVIFALVFNLKFCILDTQFNTTC
jgi:hypothetical protein